MPINLIHSNHPHSYIFLALQPLLYCCLTDDSMNILNEPHLATPLSVCHMKKCQKWILANLNPTKVDFFFIFFRFLLFLCPT